MRASERRVNLVFTYLLRNAEACPRTTTRMDPPQFLLDVLTDSITSGTFVDTKLYVFSRRERSGRVGSPRALYCNSRVLNTVPYLSACGYRKPVLRCASNRMAPKCSQRGFRKDKRGISTENSRPTPTLTPMIMSICPTVTSKMGDFILEREVKNLPKMMAPKCRAVRRAQSRKCLSPHPRKIRHGHHQTYARFKMTTGEPQYPSNCSIFLANSYHRPENHLTRMGKVAIIRDIGAVTYGKSVAN